MKFLKKYGVGILLILSLLGSAGAGIYMSAKADTPERKLEQIEFLIGELQKQVCDVAAETHDQVTEWSRETYALASDTYWRCENNAGVETNDLELVKFILTKNRTAEEYSEVIEQLNNSNKDNPL